ncbi:hypothetical protein [Streptomyces sp. VB1]|uniref:hypothetical protein n=1 Tax=unclassified Streptomyces TaxID=2593676 RepID=UPI003A0FF733
MHCGGAAIGCLPADVPVTADGTVATVDSVRHYRTSGRTFDLTVAGVHTYYVPAGKTPVLVHNSNCIRASVAYQDSTRV